MLAALQFLSLAQLYDKLLNIFQLARAYTHTLNRFIGQSSEQGNDSQIYLAKMLDC